MASSGSSPDVPLETFSKVVEAVYDCALDPNRWHDTVRMIADLCESQWCVLGVHDYTHGRNDLTFQVGWDNELWQLHEGKYRGMNPYLAPLRLQPVGAVNTGAMLVDDRELFESRFYRELCKPHGVCDALGLKVLETGQRLGLLSVNRLEPRPRYGEPEIRLFRLLAPHVCRAVAISDVLNLKTIRSEALEAALNALTSCVYLVDRLGRIIYMNRAAEHQARTSNALRVEHDRLVPLDRNARVAMGNAITQAIADEAETPASGMTLALPDREGAGLVATILPLGRGERRNVCGAFAAMAAIFVQDPVVVPPFPGKAFAKLHGLTGGELRVLLAMAPGLGVKEAAEVLGISEATARTHVQHIYDKTGTSKQTELMHLFMSASPPVKVA